VRDAVIGEHVCIASGAVVEESVSIGNVFMREGDQKRGYALLFGEGGMRGQNGERRISR
jgi:hypothetical protein